MRLIEDRGKVPVRSLHYRKRSSRERLLPDRMLAQYEGAPESLSAVLCNFQFKECDQDEDGKISHEELSICMAETIYVIETVVKNYASQQLNEEGTTSSNESEAEGRSD